MLLLLLLGAGAAVAVAAAGAGEAETLLRRWGGAVGAGTGQPGVITRLRGWEIISFSIPKVITNVVQGFRKKMFCP